jgi:hypothetical protein
MRLWELLEDINDDTIQSAGGMSSPVGPNAHADMAQASVNDAAKLNPKKVMNDPNNTALTKLQKAGGPAAVAASQVNNPAVAQAANQNNPNAPANNGTAQNGNTNTNNTATKPAAATGNSSATINVNTPNNNTVPNNLKAGQNVRLPLGPNKTQQQFKVGAVNNNDKTVTLINPKSKNGQPLAQVYPLNDVNNAINFQGNGGKK